MAGSPAMTEPCQLAALTPEGTLVFHDVGDIVADNNRDELLAVLRRQVGGHVDRVRVHTRAGIFQVYLHEYGPRFHALPRNRCAENVLIRLGMDLQCAGTVLFMAVRDDVPVGLSEQQQHLLRDLLAAQQPRTAERA